MQVIVVISDFFQMDTSSTRSSSTKPLIGHSQEDVPKHGLPSVVDVLRVISCEREKPKAKKKSVVSFCCSMNKDRDSSCLLENGCYEREDPCLIYKVKKKWKEAGIVTVSDARIREKLVDINDDYNKVMKSKSKTTPGAEAERAKYQVDIAKTFDISDPNARQAILDDFERSDEAKIEDLAFLDDYLGDTATRSWQLADRDTEYDVSVTEATISNAEQVEKKEEREARKAELREMEKRNREERERSASLTSSGCSEVEDEATKLRIERLKRREESRRGEGQERDEEGCEEEITYERRTKRKRRRRRKRSKVKNKNLEPIGGGDHGGGDSGGGDSGGGGGDSGGGDSGGGESESDDENGGVLARIPYEILKLTSTAALRMELSHGDHVVILAAFLRACGVNLDDFPLSYSTSYRRRKETIEETSQETLTKFQEEATAGNWPLFVHLDTKELTDSIGPRGAGVSQKKERLAVVLTSPMTSPTFQGEQFVSAPGIQSSSGRHQADAAYDDIENLGVIDLLDGAHYDTTASNSSPAVGTVALLENRRGKQLLKTPCRRHIYDLFGKNTKKVVSGRPSSGPGDPIFLRYNKGYAELVDNIDYDNLRVFDVAPWLGTFVEQLVFDVRNWAKHAYNTQVFPRGDYYDLLNLIIMFLGANPPGFVFKFHKPKRVSNARFMQPAEYYITLELLSRQINFLSNDQKKEVSDMAFICALFYGPGFLKCSMGSSAAFNDLTSMMNYRNLRNYMKPAADEALATWNRHLDFLTPQHIVASLLCDDFSDEQREGLASALLDLLPLRNHNLPPTRVTYPGPNFAINDAFWPTNDNLPRLSQFATLDSFLIFNILEISDIHLQEWWETPVDQWIDDENSPNYKSGFHQLKVFVSFHQYTNDAAERYFSILV